MEYCSKDCQRAHWKANHKQRCIATAKRVPQQEDPSKLSQNVLSKTTATGNEECSICLDSMIGASTCTLECAHVFHSACIADLRKFRVKQACPLCRSPLLQGGADMLCDEAFQRYSLVFQHVMRGEAHWSALPESLQFELDSAISAWRAAANQGLSNAQFNLGLLLSSREGLPGLPHSDIESAQWFTKAAEQGHVEAQMNLSTLFTVGCGVEQSDAKATRWCKIAAEQGSIDAQFKLGIMYYIRKNVQSDKAAAHWWQKAARQGHAVAQWRLGLMFAFGQGVAENQEEAAQWYIMSAEQGLPEAQYTLAVMFGGGCGVTQCDLEAERWFRKAADQGMTTVEYKRSVKNFSWLYAAGWHNSRTEEQRSMFERR